jgi:hypothetical protein
VPTGNGGKTTFTGIVVGTTGTDACVEIIVVVACPPPTEGLEVKGVGFLKLVKTKYPPRMITTKPKENIILYCLK